MRIDIGKWCEVKVVALALNYVARRVPARLVGVVRMFVGLVLVKANIDAVPKQTRVKTR